jgi:ribonuclease Z
VVLSGDTSFCPSLLDAAQGADMLVCEALNRPMLAGRVAALRSSGVTLQASLLEDVPSYHIATDEIAKVAREAGVGELVLSHLIPPISNDAAQEEEFTRGMGKVYRGAIRVARDTERLQVRHTR